jgi:hypothetical protein
MLGFVRFGLNWIQSAKFNHYPLWVGHGLTI